MKKPIILLVAGVVVAGAGVGYVISNKDSGNGDNSSSQSQNNSNKANSSNFEEVKDGKLEGKLVDSFPKDQVPLYPGEIKSSLGKMNSTGDRGEWNVEVTTKDALPKVDKSIRTSYEGDDWSIATDSKTALGGTMLIARSNKHTATITYDDMGEDGILINYGVSQR